MNRSFRGFDERERGIFLDDLSELVAYPTCDFDQVKFWDGCVTFQALLPFVAVIRLLETFKLAKEQSNSDSEETKEMQIFIEKHSVTSVYSRHLSEENFKENLSNLSRYYGTKPETDQKSKWLCFVHGWRWEGEFVTKECNETFGRLPNFLSIHFNSDTNFFNYKTGVSTQTKSLLYVAKALSNKLHELYLEYQATPDTEKQKDFKLALITHSAGGIIARKCMTLTLFQKERNSCVKNITLIASPVSGVTLLNIVAKFPGISDQVKELAHGSAFLNELNENWINWRNANQQCQVRCVYSPEDQVVTATDAVFIDPKAISLLGVDHVSIKEVDSPDNELFKILVRFLEEANF
jgi:hypothetical protein